MIPSFPSSESLRDNPPSPNPNHFYTNIPFENIRYRLRTQQFLTTTKSINLWVFFWISILFFVVGLLVKLYTSLFATYAVIFAFGFLGMLPLLYYLGAMGRQNVSKMIQFSACSLVIYLLISTIIGCFCDHKFVYPTIFYIIFCLCQVLAEFIGSMMFLSDRSHFFGKFLIFLQLFVLILKIDDLIETDWKIVVFGFVITFFACAAMLISMLAFVMVNKLCFMEPIGTIKHKGLAYIGLHLLGFLTLSCIPTLPALFQLTTPLNSVPIFIVVLLQIYFSNRYRQEIILFLCKVQKIKNNNQLISLMRISPQKYTSDIFFEKSESWFSLIDQKLYDCKKVGISENLRVIGEERCLICLEKSPDVVWMPCGHRCVCDECTFEMFNHKSSCCVLCKDVPEAVYLTRVRQLQGEREDESQTKIQNIEEFDIEEDMKREFQEKYQQNQRILEILEAYSVMIT